MQLDSRMPLRFLYATALAGAAAAQIEVADTVGSAQAPAGTAVCILADVDGDGRMDWAVGGSKLPGGAGFVRVLSGASGAVLHEWTDAGTDPLGRALAACGDLNGDGRPELVVTRGTGATRRLEVLSTGSWSVLHTIAAPHGNVLFGAAVGCVGDVTGDGVDDFAAWWPEEISRVYVYDGASAAQVHVLTSGGWFDDFGAAIGTPGDLDGDGRAEILVGAPWALAGHWVPGAAYVHRGSDGGLLRAHDAWTMSLGDEEFGEALAFPGDVDGDGVPDYAIASRYPSGRMRLFSGAAGIELMHWFEQGDFFNLAAIAAVGDLDGDGAADLAMMIRSEIEPRIAIYSTRPPYAMIDSLRGRASTFGSALAGGEDLDGDGSPDLLVAIPGYLSTHGGVHAYAPGRVVHHTLSDLDAEASQECQSGPNSSGRSAKIWFEGSLRVSDGDFELWAWDGPVHQFGVFFFGPNAAEVPFGNGFRCIAAPFTRLGAVNSGSDGVSRIVLPPAQAGIAPGATMRFQHWFRDPLAGGSSFDLSDAFVATFAP